MMLKILSVLILFSSIVIGSNMFQKDPSFEWVDIDISKNKSFVDFNSHSHKEERLSDLDSEAFNSDEEHQQDWVVIVEALNSDDEIFFQEIKPEEDFDFFHRQINVILTHLHPEFDYKDSNIYKENIIYNMEYFKIWLKFNDVSPKHSFFLNSLVILLKENGFDVTSQKYHESINLTSSTDTLKSHMIKDPMLNAIRMVYLMGNR